MASFNLKRSPDTPYLSLIKANQRREFLMWGNDNGPLTPTADLPSSAPATNRLTRLWRAAETYEVGNVSISFDLSSVQNGILFNYPPAFVLLIDNDETLSNAAMITGPLVNGQVVTFNGINFNHGDYFSISFPTSPPVFYQFIPNVFKE